MAFVWNEYFEIAHFLCEQCKLEEIHCSNEAVIRCAISRAYYAAFCHARNYARDNQHFQPTYDIPDHEGVREHYFLQNRSDIARRLEDLRGWRNNCDYDDEIPPIIPNYKNALQRAQYILNDL